MKNRPDLADIEVPDAEDINLTRVFMEGDGRRHPHGPGYMEITHDQNGRQVYNIYMDHGNPWRFEQ